MVSLLDVNLLIALAWPNHVHHRSALAWFKRNQTGGWATASLTESGFVRVSSNKAIIPEARSPLEAILLLRRIVSLAHHEFWPDDFSFASFRRSTPPRSTWHLRRAGTSAALHRQPADLAAWTARPQRRSAMSVQTISTTPKGQAPCRNP